MRRQIISITFSYLIFGLIGCSTARIDRLERSLNDLRQLQAEQTSQLETVGSELRQLRGRVEEIEYSQNKKIGSEVDSLRNQLSTLKRRVPPPAVVPVSYLEDDEVLARGLPTDVGSRFSQALQILREGNFSDAVPLLQSALDASEGKPYSANILFWLGVSYDGLGDTRNGLLAYNQIVTTHPTHPLVAASLLRQAVLLEKTRDTKTALIILRKLIADYPKTSEAAEAKEHLRRLGEK